jgi:hypothetical protein
MVQKLSLILVLLGVAAGFSPAQAQVQCGDVIDTPAALTTDLTCNTDPALTVQGPGGALDLHGHTVRCVDNQNQDGIVWKETGRSSSTARWPIASMAWP